MPMTKVIERESNGLVFRLFCLIIKACVRAMDAVQQFAKQLGVIVPQKFVIGGASKVGFSIFPRVKYFECEILAWLDE